MFFDFADLGKPISKCIKENIGRVSQISGFTHTYFKIGCEPFLEKTNDPNSVFVPAVFLAGAFFVVLKSLALFMKRAFLDTLIVTNPFL